MEQQGNRNELFCFQTLEAFGLKSAVDFIFGRAHKAQDFNLGESLEPLRGWIGNLQTHPYYDLWSEKDGLYMKRDWLIAKSDDKPAARIHQINRSDVDRASHNHPWRNVSVVLNGCYYELIPADQQEDFQNVPEHIRGLCKNTEPMRAIKRVAGDVVCREAHDRHKILIDPNEKPTSLFITSPKSQEWGFFTEQGFVHHQQYLTDESSTDQSK